ncbi:MAG: hypothetical protein RXR31_00775 [Thermoproteota archaeon]
MSKLKAECDDERDCFSKGAMDKALEELRDLGWDYYKELNSKRLKKRRVWFNAPPPLSMPRCSPLLCSSD